MSRSSVSVFVFLFSRNALKHPHLRELWLWSASELSSAQHSAKLWIESGLYTSLLSTAYSDRMCVTGVARADLADPWMASSRPAQAQLAAAIIRTIARTLVLKKPSISSHNPVSQKMKGCVANRVPSVC